MDHFDTIRILASTLGFPIFDKIQQPKTRTYSIAKERKRMPRENTRRMD